MTTAEHTGADRHASWLELFFDLVVVAGIGALTHLLHADHGPEGLALYVIAFVAFWLVWACFTTYSNIAGEGTRARPMLLGMAALAVMMAAVPEINGEHATAFSIAYVIGRILASRPFQRGTVVLDLPVVQALGGVVPWMVSWWFDGSVVYVLWAIGLAIDVGVLLLISGPRLARNAQEHLDGLRDRIDGGERRGRAARRGAARAVRPGRAGRGPADGADDLVGSARGRDSRRGGRELPDTVSTLTGDEAHLGERLGLFVIIVLGEGMIQAVAAAGEATWDARLALAGAGTFVLLVTLWALAVRGGYAGVALLGTGAVSPRAAWPLHLVTTGALATLVAVLGGVLAEPGESLTADMRWLLLVAFGLHGLVGAAVHLVLGIRRDDPRGRQTALLLAVPTIVAGAVIVVAGDQLAAVGQVWVLAAALVVSYAGSVRSSPRPEDTGAPRLA
ncbi:low temperature requirement protein A [Occultella gossypii]|uniref:Low temperature requirement protein A n=1 Tax=Occultella gossypii TaxID=2800820 RepID=A0ABS7S830_9MICO|nr:low temperature requirement protein A [Occultella gossypii]MBZ2195774.1 low temperature requirement protein A [Occultella gossypii]